jgi:hypothetical protein
MPKKGVIKMKLTAIFNILLTFGCIYAIIIYFKAYNRTKKKYMIVLAALTFIVGAFNFCIGVFNLIA